MLKERLVTHCLRTPGLGPPTLVPPGLGSPRLMTPCLRTPSLGPSGLVTPWSEGPPVWGHPPHWPGDPRSGLSKALKSLLEAFGGNTLMKKYFSMTAVSIRLIMPTNTYYLNPAKYTWAGLKRIHSHSKETVIKLVTLRKAFWVFKT